MIDQKSFAIHRHNWQGANHSGTTTSMTGVILTNRAWQLKRSVFFLKEFQKPSQNLNPGFLAP